MITNPEQQILVLTAHGRLRPPTDGTTPQETVQRIFEGFAASGRTSMTIYFHGGLVNEATAKNLADHFHDEICDNFDSYPVFIIWKSGPLETLQSALLEISSSSPLFMQVLKKLVKWSARLLGKDVEAARAMTESMFSAPAPSMLIPAAELLRMLEAEQLPLENGEALTTLDALVTKDLRPLTDDHVALLQQELAADPDADRALGFIIHAARRQPTAVPLPEMAARGAMSTSSATGHLSAALVAQLAMTASVEERAAAPLPESLFGFTSPADWFFAGDVLHAIFTRFDSGTDHGFMGTILEEMYRTMYGDKIGRFLWDEMKENAAEAYDPIATDAPLTDLPGGTLFLEAMGAYSAEHGTFDLHLIGHSAGSIHIAHFIAAGAARFDNFSLANLILTAPAINYALFSEKIVPYGDRIGNFRIFTMADAFERRDPLVKLMPLLYPHSLLYFVSGLFEDQPDSPLLGLARHLQYADDGTIQEFLALFTNAEYAPVVYAVTPRGTPIGEQACFTSHYGNPGPNFDRATLNSMANQIRPAPVADLMELAAAPPAETDALEPAAAVILATGYARGLLPMDTPTALDERDWEAIVDGAPWESGPILEQIIGTNDLIDHAFVDAFLRAGHAVARIVAMGVRDVAAIPPDERAEAWSQAQATNRLYEGYGTGWILGSARRVLVTNNHVLPLVEAARTAKVEFGYERILRRGIRAELMVRLRPDQLFLTDPNMAFGGLDYSVIALSRQAPAELGYLDAVPGVTARRAEHIYIVQHPGGGGKAYVLNHNSKVNLPDRYVTYISDTLEGSSGSPLFNGDGDLVGIHHLGNYMATVGTKQEITNLGSRIECVIDNIAAKLRAQEQFTEEQVAYWFGADSSVLQAWRALG